MDDENPRVSKFIKGLVNTQEALIAFDKGTGGKLRIDASDPETQSILHQADETTREEREKARAVIDPNSPKAKAAVGSSRKAS